MIEPVTSRCSPEDPDRNTRGHLDRALLSLASRPECDSRPLVGSSTARAPKRSNHRLPDGPPMRSLDPPAFEAAGSDLRRAYLTRLCSTFRLLPPPGALLRPQPFRPCFMPVTLMGFHLQRIPPTGSQTRLTTSPSPLVVSTVASASAKRSRPPRAVHGSRDLSTRWIRSRGPVLPGDPRPILSWYYPFEVLTLQASVPCFHGPSSHGLRRAARRLPAHRHTCSAECQRTRRSNRPSFEDGPPSVRFVSSKSA